VSESRSHAAEFSATFTYCHHLLVNRGITLGQLWWPFPTSRENLTAQAAGLGFVVRALSWRSAMASRASSIATTTGSGALGWGSVLGVKRGRGWDSFVLVMEESTAKAGPQLPEL
jgi:hypothetical protein